MNQYDFLCHLHEKTGENIVIIDSNLTFNARRISFKKYDYKKNTIGRYLQNNELACELDIHLSKNILVDWNIINKTAVDFVKLKNHTLGRFTGKIPVNLFDSGRGIHLSVFTSNLLNYSEKVNLPARMIAKEVWSFLEFKSDNTDNCLLNRRTNSVIRATGGFNPKSGSYKSFIPNEYTKKKFFKKEEVRYPFIKLWKIPKGILKTSVKRIRRRELLKKLTKVPEPEGELMKLPCFKKMVNAQIPATGKSVRNLIAGIITYMVLHDSGSEELAKKYIDIYVDSIHKVDSSFPHSSSQYGWIQTIQRNGIENWSFDCGRIKYFQKILNKFNVNICTNCR